VESVAYESPTVLGSFAAQDILGSADGQLVGGSTIMPS
jgi:hypothetical protein